MKKTPAISDKNRETKRRQSLAGHTTRDLRRQIQRAKPAFLQPNRFPAQEADESLCLVLIGYAVGSEAAVRLIKKRPEIVHLVQNRSREDIIALAIAVLESPDADLQDLAA